ncbi:uncharacterized protein BO72DRAFT_495378 [Aspergillus fijiensis CBS 313.89]|uniref:Uncharacterized protein n=1 Tax=Aspergillus fijiensis CBS 313.89 TaxID=1448319 RepID=A0A8G1RTX3_9EURO|nr:uncharacterized protein BO72DRAFT_495378 [Aspergillus fijiensis CBS 313.89]RAK78233.1 hypothetical protein BO72DRAFT_495378 [Aspergillus fijiensis CBS 313.89]
MSLLHLWDIRGKALIAMDEFHGQGYLLPALEIAKYCKAKYKLSTMLNRRARAFLGATETWFFAQQDRSFIGTPIDQWPLPNDLLLRLAKVER